MASAKEKAWLEHYFQCGFNATEAARRAKYKNPEVMGCRKAKKFEKEIAARMADLVMDADEALARISEIARGEWGNYVDKNGNVDLEGLTADGKGYLIHSVSYTKDGTPIIKFYDAQGALRDIAKIHGKFVERVEHSGSVEVKDKPDLGKLTDDELEELARISKRVYSDAGGDTEGTREAAV
jgi:phage terminase small subunit